MVHFKCTYISQGGSTVVPFLGTLLIQCDASSCWVEYASLLHVHILVHVPHYSHSRPGYLLSHTVQPLYPRFPEMLDLQSRADNSLSRDECGRVTQGLELHFHPYSRTTTLSILGTKSMKILNHAVQKLCSHSCYVSGIPQPCQLPKQELSGVLRPKHVTVVTTNNGTNRAFPCTSASTS